MLNEFGVFIDNELVSKCYVPNARLNETIDDATEGQDENTEIIDQGKFKRSKSGANNLFTTFLYYYLPHIEKIKYP